MAAPVAGERGVLIGVQVKVETFSRTDAKAIRASGFAFVRLGVWTNRLHDIAYQKRVRAAFAAADDATLPVLVTLRSTQPLAPNATDASRDAALQTAGHEFAQAVLAFEHEFGRHMLAIELWNEPDLGKYWPTGNAAATFAPFMRAVCAQLGAQPHAVPIYGFGFSRAPVRGTPADALLRDATRGQPACVDAVSYHAYGMRPDAIRAAAREIRERYGVPAVITEWGVPSNGIVGADTAQASRISGFLATLPDTQTPLVSIYEWKDTISGANVRERSYGLVDASGAPKPSLEAARGVLQAPRPMSPAR